MYGSKLQPEEMKYLRVCVNKNRQVNDCFHSGFVFCNIMLSDFQTVVLYVGVLSGPITFHMAIYLFPCLHNLTTTQTI